MHRLTSLLFAVTTSTPLFAGELDGRFQADLAGANTVLDLQQQGQVVTGRYSENGTLQLDLRGQYDGQVLNAEIVLPQTNQVIATLAATYGNDQLNARLAARDPVSGQVLERQTLFQRSPSHATGAARTSAGTLDPALVGTWVHEDIINSGGASFASFNTVLTLHLAPTAASSNGAAPSAAAPTGATTATAPSSTPANGRPPTASSWSARTAAPTTSPPPATASATPTW